MGKPDNTAEIASGIRELVDKYTALQGEFTDLSDRHAVALEENDRLRAELEELKHIEANPLFVVDGESVKLADDQVDGLRFSLSGKEVDQDTFRAAARSAMWAWEDGFMGAASLTPHMTETMQRRDDAWHSSRTRLIFYRGDAWNQDGDAELERQDRI